MQQLQAHTGVSARTLRHWMRQGLLPKAGGRGRGAHYDRSHVLVARAVLVLRARERSLDKIRARLALMGERELLELSPDPQSRSERVPEPAPEPPSRSERMPEPPREPSYPFKPWESIELMAGMILLVDTTKGPAVRRIADDIHRHYGLR